MASLMLFYDPMSLTLQTLKIKMQLNVARLRYDLDTALSVLTDKPSKAPEPPTSPTPIPPRGELKRSINTRLSILRYEQIRWIAPRLNISAAEFTRIALDVAVDHIIQQNPQILVEDFPSTEVEQPTNPQMSLFTDETSLPALVTQKSLDAGQLGHDQRQSA